MVEVVFKTRRPLAVFIASLLCLLILMSYQVTDTATGRSVLGNLLFGAFSPVQSGLMWAMRGGSDTASRYFQLIHTNEENETLRREVAELKIRIAATSQDHEENIRLRRMLQLEQRLPFVMLTGEVVGRDARSGSGTVTANRGHRSGVRMNMAVVTSLGVVGKTIQVAPVTSQIQLITDNASAIGVMLERTQIAGILSGSGQTCILRYLPQVSDVKVGDVVVTSGQDGVFPQGLPVGKLTRLTHESDLYKSGQVTPFQEYSSTREIVFLLQTATTTSALDK